MSFPPAPSSPSPVHAVVRAFAAGRLMRAVWVNEVGGVTFRVGAGSPGTEFIKVADADVADFAGEAMRLRWAARYVTVPQVLGWGLDGSRAWLRTGGATRGIGGTPSMAGRTRGCGAGDRHGSAHIA